MNIKRILTVCLAIVCLALHGHAEAKYIFYFIGDGMGSNQILAAEMYQAELEGKIGRNALQMSSLPYSGNAVNFSSSNAITCSAAAGTALATGHKTNANYIGVDKDGNAVESVAEKLKKNGWSVGIMTSVSIDHATPACFYAHEMSRNSYYTIGEALAESNFDFFGGASFLQPTDKKNHKQPNLYDLCESKGYTFARGRNDAQQKMNAQKMIMIPANEGLDKTQGSHTQLPFAINRTTDDLKLSDITEAAIQFLQAKNNNFFMMIEGGNIDWACHNNDAACAVREVIDMDESVRLAYQFYLAHPDETLIVVTADHETGGMSLGVSDYTLKLSNLESQRISSNLLSDTLKNLHKHYGKKLKWQQVKQVLEDETGLYSAIDVTVEEDVKLQGMFRTMMKHRNEKQIKNLYNSLGQLSATAIAMVDKKAKIGWTTHGHSALVVPVFAVGVGAEQFTGWQDNTEIMPKILHAAGL